MFEVQGTCHCQFCQSTGTVPESSHPAGCLRTHILNNVLLLIAHSIADGFGCEDISASQSNGEVLRSILSLILELCKAKQVTWDTLFYTAACVYLGFLPNNAQADYENDDSSFREQMVQLSTYAAIQYGNLSVVAPWLDLSSQLRVRRCFRLIPGKGAIGVVHHIKDSQSLFQLQGIDEVFAIIRRHETARTTSYTSQFKRYR